MDSQERRLDGRGESIEESFKERSRSPREEALLLGRGSRDGNFQEKTTRR